MFCCGSLGRKLIPQKENIMINEASFSRMNVVTCRSAVLACLVAFLVTASGIAAEAPAATAEHGLVGLRPLPRTEVDLKSNHGGPWTGMPTFEQAQGTYPFVAKHLDIVSQWTGGDFNTKRGFFEYYWGSDARGDSLDPHASPLVGQIRTWEASGGEIEHILVCREYDLLIHHGYPDATPGPFQEDTRILFSKDVSNIRQLFRDAHKLGLLKHGTYKLIQMVQEPSFFADDERAHPIIDAMDGVCLEVHQFNRHWPLETGWVRPDKVVRGARWTLDRGKEYIFYFGPIEWKSSDRYSPFIERDWLKAYWAAGLPKRHPRMHYSLNTFPHATGRGRPVGPESDPHSILGFTTWLIEEIKGVRETPVAR